jgi:hypothetical protein
VLAAGGPAKNVPAEDAGALAEDAGALAEDAGALAEDEPTLDAGGLAEEGLAEDVLAEDVPTEDEPAEDAGGLAEEGPDAVGRALRPGRGDPSALAPGTRCGSGGSDDREDAAGGDSTCGSGCTGGSSGGAGGSGSVLVPSESRSSDIRRACGNFALAASAPGARRSGEGGRLSSAMATP